MRSHDLRDFYSSFPLLLFYSVAATSKCRTSAQTARIRKLPTYLPILGANPSEATCRPSRHRRAHVRQHGLLRTCRDNIGSDHCRSSKYQCQLSHNSSSYRQLASAPRNALLRHPFIRRIYLVFFLLGTLLLLLPAWTILYLPRRNRPRVSWTLQRCLRVRWSRRLCALVARCEIDYLGRDLNLDMVNLSSSLLKQSWVDVSQEPDKLTHSHPVTIPPAPADWLRGHARETLDVLLASRGSWSPHLLHRSNRSEAGVWGSWGESSDDYGFAPVKAFWFDGKKVNPQSTRRTRQPGQAVMLHFHGGGYLCGTAAETDLTSGIPKHLVIHSPIHHVLSVDYRLAPKAPWPLPLLDAISAYHHLVHDELVDEKDIVLVGDSAGGHLAIALTRWIRDEGRALGLNGPRGLVVMSPWCDVGFTNAWGDGLHYNADCDTVSGAQVLFREPALTA